MIGRLKQNSQATAGPPGRQRDHSIMIPHGDTVLRLGDRLGLIGSPTALQEAAALLRG